MFQIMGNVHSIESCGTVDGPGVRFVVFLQGCPMRCQYCHNPDTWNFNINQRMTVDEILTKYESVKEFLKNGGLTVTGGEPLAQIDFVTELFKKAKLKGIHTALDTSGILFNKNDTAKIDELLKYTNLVLLDIKHIDNNEHNKLTGHPNLPVLEFAKYLSDNKIDIWIRHVVIPKITMITVQLECLGEFLSHLDNIKGLDVLPYHKMGIKKYEELNMEYKLKNIPVPSKEEVAKARNVILESMKKNKLKNMGVLE